jgi:hypothetical protein
MSSIFGPLFSAHQIEESVVSNLRTWIPTYLAEAARQHGVKLAPVRSWGLASEFDRWPEQGYPALVVAADGIGKGSSPEKYGGGNYRAGWACGVTVAVRAATLPEARKYGQIYAAVIRGVMLQRRSLGEAGQVAEWLDEGYGAIEVEQKRTTFGAENVFVITKDEVINWRQGPKGDAPPDEIPEAWPIVNEVDVKTEVEE